MTDTTVNLEVIDTDDEVDATPETLRTDLAQLYLRATASPTPRHPAAFGWQMTAGSLAALASRLLDVVQRTAPEDAAEVAEWFAGPFGDGPDLEDHTDWVGKAIAGDVGVLQAWIDEARQLAVEAKDAAAEAPVEVGTVNGRPIPPETVAYSEDGEDCGACSEIQDLCRYHQGWADGASDAKAGAA
ncbi:hypothetical protein [Streptomyces sp. NPDC093589]|uniref:hypothetical protein n=1 Tax=Streptomyces sp. NPDC093589 TaxID=3366043 RepID=UPI0038215DCF